MPGRLVIAAAVLAVVLLAVLAWWTTRPPLVPAVSARTASLVRNLHCSARVATASRVELGSALTGRVLAVVVAEGAQVKAGDVLVRLESDELRAALAQSQAGERQAAARLAGWRSGGRSGGRSTAQAGVAQAESVRVATQAEQHRTLALVAKGFLSEAPLVDAQRGAIEVKFSLPQPTPAFLREDMTLSIEVETARREQALVVPADALRGDDPTGTSFLVLTHDPRLAPRCGRQGTGGETCAVIPKIYVACEVSLRHCANRGVWRERSSFGSSAM